VVRVADRHAAVMDRGRRRADERRDREKPATVLKEAPKADRTHACEG